MQRRNGMIWESPGGLLIKGKPPEKVEKWGSIVGGFAQRAVRHQTASANDICCRHPLLPAEPHCLQSPRHP